MSSATLSLRYLFIVALVPWHASITQAQDLSGVYIANAQYQGSGCQAGSVGSYMSDDRKVVTLMFDTFAVSSSNSTEPRMSKNCMIDLQLNVPPGLSYNVFRIDQRGYASLDQGIAGVTSSAVSYGGSKFQELGSIALTGPVDRDYTTSSTVDIEETAWSECSDGAQKGRLVINTSAVVTRSGTASSVDIALSSSRGRPADLDMGLALQSIQLLKQDSASPCRLNHSFGIQGTKAWVKAGCRGSFRVVTAGKAPPDDAKGLLTVDTIDGELTHRYGVSWKKCELGKWVQVQGAQNCEQTCKSKGMRPAADGNGAQCASGEARPASAIGNIAFNMGCWGGAGCSSMGNITTQPQGPFCFYPGQKKDADRTDRTMGCFCK